MNVLDILIILFAVSSVVRGYHIGLVRQAGSTIGFVIGLFAGSIIANVVISHVDTPVARSVASLLIVLGISLFTMTAGELIGVRLKRKILHNRHIDRLDGGFGSIMSVITLLFAIWLAASVVLVSPAGGLQQLAKGSRIVAGLDRSLPPATGLLGFLNKLIDPNGFPQVFTGLEPKPGSSAQLPSLGSLNAAVTSDRASVVKIEGTGCGGIVEGSGFVITPNEVATNAHVIAGVHQPKVQDSNGIHDARVIWFDKNVDIAVLQVGGLAGKPLAIDASNEPDGTPAVVLGYPGGGSFDAQAASIIDRFSAVGRDIYGQGRTYRDIYSLQAKVVPGNSGGPLVDAQGNVIGIVFATSTTYNNVGYALTAQQVRGELAQAEKSPTTYSTGTCSE